MSADPRAAAGVSGPCTATFKVVSPSAARPIERLEGPLVGDIVARVQHRVESSLRDDPLDRAFLQRAAAGHQFPDLLARDQRHAGIESHRLQRRSEPPPRVVGIVGTAEMHRDRGALGLDPGAGTVAAIPVDLVGRPPPAA